MKLHRCRTCKQEKFDDSFNHTIVSGEPYTSTTKCKTCSLKSTHSHHRLYREYKDSIDFKDNRYEADFNKLMLMLTRLHFNNGGVTSSDCLELQSVYFEFFDERMPIFKNTIDKLSYQWNRLRELWNRNKEFQF